MAQNILRYTAKVQKQLGSKTKPEPWLHCIWMDGDYVIYVWDTRKVVEEGQYRNTNVIDGPHANDNRKPLKGAKIRWFNDEEGLLLRHLPEREELAKGNPFWVAPKGSGKFHFEDDVIDVYDENGKKVFTGTVDEFQESGDRDAIYAYKWRDDRQHYYNAKTGWTIVVK